MLNKRAVLEESVYNYMYQDPCSERQEKSLNITEGLKDNDMFWNESVNKLQKTKVDVSFIELRFVSGDSDLMSHTKGNIVSVLKQPAIWLEIFKQ